MQINKETIEKRLKELMALKETKQKQIQTLRSQIQRLSNEYLMLDGDIKGCEHWLKELKGK